MENTIKIKDGVHVVMLNCERLDAKRVQVVKKDLNAGLVAVKQVVLDMKRVKFVDSMGIGLMLSVMRAISKRGGEVRLSNVADSIQSLFEMVRITSILEIYDSVDEAVQSFSITMGEQNAA